MSRSEYVQRHKRVQKARGWAVEYECVDCGAQAKEWSHIHNTDVEDVANYQPRCIPCHRKYDYTEDMRKKHSKALSDRFAAGQGPRNNSAAGWTPERRDRQRERMKARWNEPGQREAQAERARRDQPWKGRSA